MRSEVRQMSWAPIIISFVTQDVCTRNLGTAPLAQVFCERWSLGITFLSLQMNFPPPRLHFADLRGLCVSV